jgi:hypothetical protein
MPATVGALREVLAPAFSEQRARTCLLRVREAGLLPVERASREGSAEIKPIHAALALIVMGLDQDGDAIAAVTEAQRVAGFKIVAVDSVRWSTMTRLRIRPNGITFLDTLLPRYRHRARAPIRSRTAGTLRPTRPVRRRLSGLCSGTMRRLPWEARRAGRHW